MPQIQGSKLWRSMVWYWRYGKLC